MKKYTVYLRTNNINGKQYVGQTNNIKHREDYWKSNKSCYANKLLNDDRIKYGQDNWTLDILAEVETREDAWELEKKYIKELNTRFPNGYNRAYGGKCNKGGNEGKHNSPSTEFKKGMTPWIKGKHHSEESNEKNRLAHLGKISSKRIAIVQLTLDGEFVAEFSKCKDASDALGFKSDESIRKACKETWRTSGGFKWMYKSDYEEMLAGLFN